MHLNKNYLLLTVVILITILPRILELFSSSYYFGPEQGVEYLVTKNIVVDHNFILIAHQGIGSFFKPAGFNYLIAIPFMLAKGDPYGGRIFMFAISILTVLFAFIFTKNMFNVKTAIFVSFFLAISPNLSHYAGRISPPFIISILIVCFIYSIFKVFKNNHKFILLTAFIIGFMMNFEMATSAVLFMEVFILLLVLCFKRIISYSYVIFYILIFFSFISPLLIYDLNHNFHNLNGIIRIFSLALNHTQSIAFNWSQVIDNRFSVFSWNYLSSFTPQKLISIPLFLLIYAGSIIYIKDKKNLIEQRLLMLFILASPIFTFIILLFYPGDIVQWWIIQLSIFYCFLIGIITPYFWKKNVFFKGLIVIFISILFISFIMRIKILYNREFLYPPSSYIIETEPIDYLYKDSGGNPFSVLIFASRPLQNYEYLLWWYGVKYKNKPIKSKKGGILYVLIENNQIVKDKLAQLDFLAKGSIIKTKKLKYGFIVQKRLL